MEVSLITDAILDYGQQVSITTFKHDRSTTVGASEVGMCARRVRWSKDVGDKTRVKVRTRWGAALRGNLIEEHVWVPAIRKKWGERFLLGGKSQETLIHGDLSATPDGILVGLTPEEYKRLTGLKGSGDVVVECKTIDPRVNLVEEKSENRFQVQVQMGLIRKKTKFKPSAAVITYINASFLDDVKEFVVPFDPSVFKVVEERAKAIMSTDGVKLRPEGLIAGGKECEHCRFAERCGRVRSAAVPTAKKKADEQFVAEIIDYCKEIRQYEEKAKTNDEQVRLMKQILKERLASHGVRCIDGVVSWSSFNGRSSYDMEKLGEELKRRNIDIEKYRKDGTPGDRLQILV